MSQTKTPTPGSEQGPGAASMTELAYAALEERIVTLRLKPGEFLSEQTLAEQLDLGRTPIREALQKLAREGLVVILPRRGILVSDTNVEQQLLVGRAPQAIVAEARASGSDLIVIERHAGAHTAGLILSYTDWDLLRLAEAPVLVVKTKKPYRHPGIFAAVDPMHTHAKPARLDLEILKTAAGLKSLLRGKLTIFHATPPASIATGGWMGGPVVLPPGTQKAFEQAARDALDAELERLPMPAHKVEITSGNAREAIPAGAKRNGAGIAVMGVMSRSGLKRVFVGNTAETVLDALGCDVLVVKPGKFTSSVEHMPRGPQLISIPNSFIT